MTVGAENAREGLGDIGHNGIDRSSERAVSAGGDTRGASIIQSLTQETSAATALIEQLRDLIADGDEDLVSNAVEGETNLHEAIANAFARLAELNGLMDGIAGMMASLKDRGERFEKQRDRIREAIAVAMEAGQIKRLELPIGTISLRAVPPSVQVIDEAAIPTRYWKPQEPKLDKRALLAALKADASIPGALLSNGGQTIQVTFS